MTAAICTPCSPFGSHPRRQFCIPNSLRSEQWGKMKRTHVISRNGLFSSSYIILHHVTINNQNITETVTHCLLFVFQPIYLHNLAPCTSSQPITSRVYQRLVYLLTNQIVHKGLWISNYHLTLKMASAHVVSEHSQDCNHPDNLFQCRYVTPGFKPFSYLWWIPPKILMC